MTVGAGAAVYAPKTVVGTKAWWIAIGRRNLVETSNSMLRGSFVNIDRGYVRMFDSSRIDGMVAHTIAGLNRQIARQWNKISETLGLDDDAAAADTPKPGARKPRRDRVKRFEDLEVRGNPPPPD